MKLYKKIILTIYLIFLAGNLYSYDDSEFINFSERHGCIAKEAKAELKRLMGSLKIKTIMLQYCEFKEIPQEVFTFTNLERLDLANNKIRYIPEDIGNLVNLKGLSIIYNQLQELPESIGKLMNLKQLELQNNQLNTLPKSIVNLIHIKDIDTSFNHLERNNFSFGFTERNFSYKDFWRLPDYMKVFRDNPPEIIPEAYTVTATSGLSVREKPNLKAKKIGAMPHKLKIAVYEESPNKETIDGITAPWMRIKAVANNKYMEGWAWGGYLEKFVYTE